MPPRDLIIQKAVAAAAVAAALTSGIAVSLAHYDRIVLRLVFLVWTVWPYPVLWLLATRLKRRSTRLFWSGYTVVALLFAFIFYVVPRFSHQSWMSVGLVLTPGYILNIGIVAFVVFVAVRFSISIIRSPNQSPEPTAMSVTPPAAQEPRQP